MNDEILERLLIDDAMGQLPADVKALLAAHLASSPEARKIAEEIDATVNLAAKALPRPRIATPVPSPIPRLIGRDRIHRLLALAASFVAGAGFAFLGLKGATLRSGPAAPMPAVAQVSHPIPAARPPSDVERAAQSLPFWSNRRAILLSIATRHQRESRENP